MTLIFRAAAAALLTGCCALVSACSSSPDDGYTVYQTIFIDHGDPGGRRLQVLEDERLTPGMRRVMWGGVKAPQEIAASLGETIQDPAIAALFDPEIRPAMLRLEDSSGKTLAARHFDCPLAELNENSLPQGQTSVWAIGVDCHTSTGVYEGLVTRFFQIVNDEFEWEQYTDAATPDPIELTLLNSPKIAWHLVSRPRAEDVVEVSGIPDMSDVKPGQVPTRTLRDYVRYRFNGDGLWHRSERAVPGDWQQEDGFPPESAFPPE